MKKVISVKYHNSLSGKDVWLLDLECGHQERRVKSRKKNPPVRVKCPKCSNRTT